ncbi:unnamed protein product [Mucor hiemalis]
MSQLPLTSQYWYTPSTEQLYYSIRLEQTYEAGLFMQTVKSIPSLGLLVKRLHILLFKYESSWKDHHFIDFLVNYCPNLVYLSIPHHDAPHYIQLINAGYQRKLKYLQRIEFPRKRSDTLKYYNCASLAFSKSIKTLELRDTVDLTHSSVDNTYDDDFVWLRGGLQHFTKLEKLTVVQHSDQGLIGIDNIIDTCNIIKHLVTTFVPFHPTELSSGFQDSALDIPSTQPCLHVKIFEGHNTLLDHEDSVKYLMHKFPKLQKLKLTDQSLHFMRKRFISVPSSTQTAMVAAKFLNYLSQIPSVTVEFDLKGVDIDNLIDAMLKNNNRFNNKITLEYDAWGECRKDVYFEDQLNTTIRFSSPSMSSSTVSLFDQFIEKSGHYIRSLSVYSADAPDSRLKNIGDWLRNLVQQCPDLKELEILNSIHMGVDPSKLKGLVSPVEKLTIHGLQNSSALPHLCTLFPRLNYLFISSTYESRSARFAEMNTLHFLDMPHTSLDKLVWVYGGYGYVTNYQYQIKITTALGTFYYVADTENAKPSTARDFMMAFKKFQLILEINCKKLVDLHITHMNLSEKIYHLDV